MLDFLIALPYLLAFAVLCFFLWTAHPLFLVALLAVMAFAIVTGCGLPPKKRR